MKSIKEKRILVKWARAMNEPVDPALAEEVERYDQLQREVTESIKSNTIKDLLGAAQGVKLSAESINIPAPAQVIKIEYPKPPSLYELELLLQEVQDELVQAHPSKESFTDQAPATEKNTAVEIKNDSLIERASKHITQEVKNESQSYQQPDPELPGRNIDDLRKKIKYLEAWISKISLTGPGGGEVNLLKLDDVDTSAIGNGKYLRYNAANAKIEFATVTGGSGIALTDLSVAVDAPSGNGNLVYDNNTGIFNFTPTSLANKANISDLTTANVIELTNLYYTNARARQAISVAGAGSYDNTTGIITITSSSSYNDANTYSNVTLLGYITSSSLSGYATNSQLGLYATSNNVDLKANVTDLTTANVSEVTNLYFTNARVVAAVTGNLALKANVVDLTTANVIELNSLYFTDARARQAISTSGCTLSYSNTTGIISFSQGNTDTINEGSTNLYYTNARVFAAVTGNLALKANATDLTTANVAELTELYFTNARVYANVTSIGYIKEVANTSPITTSNTQGVVTIGLSPSGVSAATYGNATIVPVFTVDTFGRITSASNATIVAGITAVANTAPISATTSGSTATIAHLNSGVTANTYGGINRVPVITVNATGHITSSSNVAIAPRVMAILGFLNS